MIGQRWVRILCDECKKPAKLEEEKLNKVKEILEKLNPEEKKKVDFNSLNFFEPGGCDKCQGLGYRGRIGVYEILVINEEIEKIILSGKASEYDMRNIGIKNGMVTMIQDGILKAIDGVTSISEIFRVAEDKL